MKTKVCKGCNRPYEKLPEHEPFRNWCSADCAIVIARNKKEKSFKKETRKRKKLLATKDIKKQHELTQKSFNKMRVLQEIAWFEDHGSQPTCISCNKPNMDWCCGHFKTRKSQGNLRYDEKNTFLQCNYYCNMNMSGNIEGNKTTRGYKQGLIDRFGDEGREVIEYCETNTQVKKWTCEELISMRSKFNSEIRRLQNEHDS